MPKSIRPIVELPESLLGSKKGAIKQYRLGRLHIREYDDRYSVHLDKISPEVSPLGHLIADAPEYMVGAAVGFAVGRKVGTAVYQHQKKCKGEIEAAATAIAAGCIAGALSGKVAHSLANHLKKSGV
ncbi:MAG TPA: hypothetical protein VFA15_03255 [Nitrososphaera sp.]|nr:hypothetical protein [Nitrososphaera sp.]